MLCNTSDGSKYCLDTVLEIIEGRCAKESYPSFSDAFGADWGFGRWNGGTPEQYKAVAIDVARNLYSN